MAENHLVLTSTSYEEKFNEDAFSKFSRGIDANVENSEDIFLDGIWNFNAYENNSSAFEHQPYFNEVGIIDLNSRIVNSAALKTTEKENNSGNDDANQIRNENNTGDREICFIDREFKSKTNSDNKKIVRQPLYKDNGILNYDSQLFKRQKYNEDVDDKFNIFNKFSARKDNDTTYGNREQIFKSGVLNESRKENKSTRRIETPSPYYKSGILNYKKNIAGSTEIFQQPGKIYRNNIGNREMIFRNSIANNKSEIKEKSPLPFYPYSEYGILNYDSKIFKKPKSGKYITSASEEKENTKNESEKGLTSSYANRELMFTNGIIHNSKEIANNKKEELRVPPYSEAGIFIFCDSQTDTSEVNQNCTQNGIGSTQEEKQTNGESSNPSQDTPRDENSPARSRIIARVKKSRSFAILSDANEEVPKCADAGSSERNVLVIYTGGTIGMVKNADGVLAPIKGAFEDRTRTYPQLHDKCYWSKRFFDDGDKENLVLPELKDLDVRIIYKIHEKEVLLDSSNMAPENWTSIARDIQSNYDLYDGFVILHGTDTLAYTASALSFMLENIGKPVVITGSQISIFEPRSDGADNFVSALIVAGGLHIPEVTVMFGSKLFRGNRTRKISSNNFHAFDSPNFVPLVEFGIDIQVNSKAIFRPSAIERCQLHEKLSENVGLVRIYPSLTPSLLKAFLQPPIEGAVIETYGSGNIPSNPAIFREIQSAVERGVIVVNVTQCSTGSVGAPVYETGRLIHACGVISGYDMTTETALAKLAYVLAKEDWSHEKKVKIMTSNIRGELTNLTSISLENDSLIDALASSINIASPKQLIEVTDRVFSALLLYAIDKEDETTIQRMQELGAEVNSENSDGKTPLHEAVSKENVNIVKYLLLRGANVHVKTRSGESPLLTAIQRDNHAIIRLLLNCGARLSGSDQQLVTELLSLAARRGSVQRLQSLRMAGADFALRDETRQTAFHKAVLSNQPHVVRYLLDEHVEPDVPDILNCTPLDYARKLNNQEILAMLEN